MAEEVYSPIIIGAILSPQPAVVGQPVLISVAAADLELSPRAAEWPCGLLPCGEV